jgi:hypothetical protein
MNLNDRKPYQLLQTFLTFQHVVAYSLGDRPETRDSWTKLCTEAKSCTPPDLVVFTPQATGSFDGVRALMEITREDQERFRNAANRRERVTIYDHMSHRKYVVESAPCGLGCHCAARIVTQLPEGE